MMKFSYFALLSILCFSCACSKTDVLLKDAEKVNADVIKMEIDAETPDLLVPVEVK